MEKKIVYVILTVLAFFGGAILVENFPNIATLIAFLECAIGFVCGYFFKKTTADEKVAIMNEEVTSAKQEAEFFKNSLRELNGTKKKTTKKVKEA